MALTEACREDRFEGRSSFRTYVRAYIHHKCIDRIRTLGRRKHTDVESLGLASLEPSPLSRLEKTGEVRLALEVLSESSPACRELWRMLQSGMSYREMAQALSVAEGTLRLRVHRCRKRALDIRSRLLSRGSN